MSNKLSWQVTFLCLAGVGTVGYFILQPFPLTVSLASPIHSARWDAEVSPPVGWSVFQPETLTNRPQTIQLQGLDVVGPSGLLTHASDAGIVAIFSEPPQRKISAGCVTTTLTVAARDLPASFEARDASQAYALARSVVSTADLTLNRIGETRNLKRTDGVGLQARYTYLQSHEGAAVDLSIAVAALVVPVQRRCFLITLTAPSSTFHRYERLFNQVVDSFQITSRPSRN